MRPWLVTCTSTSRHTGNEIAAEILDISNWSKFEGYGPLPGIADAHFERRTADVVGTRIRVTNRDGSTHIEEIIDWRPPETLSLEMADFSRPVSLFASRFTELWKFERVNDATRISRSIELQHKSFFGWLVLGLVSRLLKKAIQRHLTQLG
jgi:hypothetical protein